MNNYSKLIKSHMISFKEVMVLNYKAIGLNETEAMVIILLYEQKKQKNHAISAKNILKYVTLTESQLSNLLVNLVERGYIELIIEDNNLEHFVLTPTVEKLGEVLEANELGEASFKDNVSQVINLLETSYQRMLTASELVIVQKWMNEKHSLKDISNAINESIKLNKMNVKYVDAILVSRPVREQADEIDPELQKVLQQINVKTRY